MANYYVKYVLHAPSEDTGGMYMAEIPILPGCRAWAENREGTLEILASVAQEFIASYKAHGEGLPEDVLASEGSKESGDTAASEKLLVAG
jgi:predicted RNase H-like HicB family nuclease